MTDGSIVRIVYKNPRGKVLGTDREKQYCGNIFLSGPIPLGSRQPIDRGTLRNRLIKEIACYMQAHV
jgi:hypothetical protein